MEISRFVAFSEKQCTFPLNTPSIAAQVPIAAHHAVARHRYGELVRGTGSSYGTHCSRTADAISNLGIANGNTGWHFTKSMPNALLESGTLNIEGKLDSFARSFNKSR